MAKIISINSQSVKKGATLAAATVAMCVNMGLSASDTEAAKAALQDIAAEEGQGSARAIIVSMGEPYGGFYA